MSIEDKVRWNQKYQTNPTPTTVIAVVKQYAPLAKGKQALDIACGMGRNSRYLASQGFEVEALDISPIALKTLEGIEGITPKEVDFDTYCLAEDRYDLIVCTYFLKRELFPQIKQALKKGGILIFETFAHHPDNTKAPSNPSFLLQEGELEQAFEEGFEPIHAETFWQEGICGDRVLRSSLVARKISD